METMNLNFQVSELNQDELTAIDGGTAKEVGQVVGYAIGFFLGGCVALGILLLD